MMKHMYPFKNILNPSGQPLSQYSTGVMIFDRLVPIYDSWVSKDYEDAVSHEEAIQGIKQALMRECADALTALEKRGLLMRS